ncbi:helix-turn-helix transcriptional regulator [uncultured Nisaea sp.]|jgi:transcriptional regulator with XRE-family HTH domain|uniref:helix-turn-helix domain-containing protein n=1 Tax=uncultured Nisaea sp. TaxID=538215 RepID=UPI0030EE861F|tara:strand:+ start:456 stop:827 length:372 start_codon:yes stop_codon:yes gene_type:complete
MTPFGAKIRQLRADRGVTLKQMATALQVSSAYLSALEHGKKGRPTVGLIHQICQYFGLIWDDAEDLKKLAKHSNPRVVIDTAGLSPKATELANTLAARIRDLDDPRIDTLLAELAPPGKGPRY